MPIYKPRGLKRLAERIKHSRERLGLTQQELEQRSGVLRSLIIRVEQCVGDTSALRLKALAQALGVSADYLLCLTDDPTPRC